MRQVHDSFANLGRKIVFGLAVLLVGCGGDLAVSSACDYSVSYNSNSSGVTLQKMQSLRTAP